MPRSSCRECFGASFRAAGPGCCWLFLLIILLLGLGSAHAQMSKSLVDSGVTVRTPPAPAKQPVASDIVIEGLASYGHYKIFASGSGAKLYTAGIEYDRNSWGRFLGAEMDYTAEILPVVLLNEGKHDDVWGTPIGTERQTVPGIGISPIGFRLLWFPDKAFKPYMMAKGGMIAFTQKVLSQKATYESFSLQSAVGLQARMTPRVDLRLGLFGDFHFSDAFMVPVNPGLDVMNASMGLVYHLGHPRGVR